MNIDRLFYILQKDGKIGEEEVLNIIDEEYLDYLLEKEILKQIDSDNYSIDNVENTFYFGRYFLKEKDYKTANRIFDCCYKMDPDNFIVNYQLFYRSLFTRKKSLVYKYFDVVYSYLEKTERKEDANLYLLLVGYLYGPNEYNEKMAEKFNNLKLEDILLPYDSEDFDIDENDLRTLIFEKKYGKANQYIDTQFHNKKLTFEEEVEKELLLEVIIHTRQYGKIYDDYARNNELKKLKDILDEEYKKKNLSLSNEYLYHVLNKYLEIKETRIIPEIKNTNTKTTFHAISNNDFKKALKLIQDYTAAKEFNKGNALYIMLEKINELIDNINKDKNYVENTTNNEIIFKDKDMIDKKIELLRNGRSLVLLEPMSQERRDLIHDYIRRYSDIISYSIGKDDERRIVLRYKTVVLDYININEICNKARDYLFEEKNYEEALKCYKLLLKIGHPKVKTYGEYGINLLKLHRTEEAVDALKIATILAKDKGVNLDYTDVIEGITNKTPYEDTKKKVKIEQKEFNDNNFVDLNSSFINDLIGLINENEINLEDACQKLNLNEEQINYVKLICARDYYYLNNQRQGDQLLKEVVKSKAKNKEIKALINEINASKKYYSNRLDSEKSQLVFKKK